LFDVRTAFERKLPLCEPGLYVTLHSSGIGNPTDVKKHAEEIQLLKQGINSHFYDMNASMRPESTYFQCHLTFMLILS
jgi:hypothetical protein